MKVSLQWKDDFRFNATNADGHSVEIDTTQVDGKTQGITPMQLLLIALAGCTGIDVVHILRKQRQELSGLAIDACGDRRAEEPRYFEKIQVRYTFIGRNLDETKIQNAIRLSEEKYCSVGSMLRAKADLTSTYVIREEAHKNI